jgi:hypothetical protein
MSGAQPVGLPSGPPARHEVVENRELIAIGSNVDSRRQRKAQSRQGAGTDPGVCAHGPRLC